MATKKELAKGVHSSAVSMTELGASRVKAPIKSHIDPKISKNSDHTQLSNHIEEQKC